MISIIVPVYGVEPYIADCLNSIIDAARFHACEMIIVDDGSLDGSMAIARARCAGLDNVTIVEQPNAGLGAARNAGLNQARGRYVWFVDSDDEICPNSLTALMDSIDRHAPDIMAFEFETIGNTLDRATYSPVFGRPVSAIEFLTSGRPPSPVQFYLFSRSLLRRIDHKFKPSIYHEDALFTPVALVGADSVVRLADTCYRYRMREGSIMSTSHPAKHLRDMASVVDELVKHSASYDPTDARWRALAREIGFALGGLRYYWLRATSAERNGIVSPAHLIKLGRPRLWYFTLRSLLNYFHLVASVALGTGAKT